MYAGISFDGKVIVTRHDVNEKFYGMKVDPEALLSGEIPPPPAAQPLYESLKRCSVHTRTMYGEAYDPSRVDAVEDLGLGGGLILEEKKVDGELKPKADAFNVAGAPPPVPVPPAMPVPYPAAAPTASTTTINTSTVSDVFAPASISGAGPGVGKGGEFNGDWPF